MIKHLFFAALACMFSLHATTSAEWPVTWQPYELTRTQHNQAAHLTAHYGARHMSSALFTAVSSFLADEELNTFMATFPREHMVMPAVYRAYDEETFTAYRTRLQEVHQQYRDEGWTEKLSTICTRLGGELLQDRHGFSIKITDRDGEAWVIKLRRLGYPMPFQNISRLYYADALQKHLANTSYNSITVQRPHTYLYNLHGHHRYDPGDPLTALHDHNWAVVEKFVPKLPTPAQNLHIIESLTQTEIAEVIQLITALGLWDIKDHNIFFIRHSAGVDNATLHVVPIDMELPGIGGAQAANFFHLDEMEKQRLARCGIALFKRLYSYWKPWRKKRAAFVAAAVIILALSPQLARLLRSRSST